MTPIQWFRSSYPALSPSIVKDPWTGKSLAYTKLNLAHLKPEEWAVELKLNGFRAFAIIYNGECQFLSKTLKPLRGYEELAKQVAKFFKVKNAIIDGEIASLNKRGVSNLTNVKKRKDPLQFCPFDLLVVNDTDISVEPYDQRKFELAKICPKAVLGIAPIPELVLLHPLTPDVALEVAREVGHEGIVIKRRSSPYMPGKSGNWMKVKCSKR